MAETVMVLASHPDDAEIGMGGTIATLTAGGHNVVIVDLTDGEPTPYGSPEIRRDETAKATQILKVTERITLDIKNREVLDSVENRKKVASVIRKFKPSLLFVPYWEDGHPDRWNATALCEAARFYSKLVKSDLPHEPHYPRKILHFFCTHIRPRAQPAFIFDVSAQFERKMQAVEAYRSQFIDNPINKHVIDLIRSESLRWGAQIGTKAGEPFTCREYIKLDSAESILNA